ncbi:hypothetical protein [Rhizobacter fulvus]
MIDRLFTATLTFCLLIGGTLAIGSAMLGIDQPVASPRAASAPAQVVQLERVVIVGKRLAPTTDVAQSDSETAPRVQ